MSTFTVEVRGESGCIRMPEWTNTDQLEFDTLDDAIAHVETMRTDFAIRIVEDSGEFLIIQDRTVRPPPG